MRILGGGNRRPRAWEELAERRFRALKPLNQVLSLERGSVSRSTPEESKWLRVTDPRSKAGFRGGSSRQLNPVESPA